ncbi:GTPase HflX [candidate division NPL-UPA2 bacterium]|nr:GTPase HflX [candidate division NPL-UPA2 bacterium]
MCSLKVKSIGRQNRPVLIIDANRKERAILVIIQPSRSAEWELDDLMGELKFLVSSAGAEISSVNTLKLRGGKPHPAYFIGRGKAEEIREIVKEKEADLVIFNDDLTPAQQRSLEEIIEARVIDHTQLILDIFARRAQSKEGKLQIELAQLNYLLPRLTGRGIELSQLGGGIGTRGPGETKLEVDKRSIRRRLVKLREEIEGVKKHRTLQRKRRRRHPFSLIALVGYTNSGKSTLLNSLSGSNLKVENKLFVTLDPATRKVKLPSKQEVLLTDTVGFIRHLPHHLVAAFKATLEEVTEADVLVVVLDASHPKWQERSRVVFQVLRQLQALNKPLIMALNKIDLLHNRSEGRRFQREFPEGVLISALKKEGLEELMKSLEQSLPGRREKVKLLIPQKEGTLLASIRREGKIFREEYRNSRVYLEVELGKETLRRWRKYQP